MSTTITTGDGHVLAVGDRAYNYYSMKPGVIAAEPDATGWFYFRHDDGTRDLLNGERICTLVHAVRMGWS